MKIEITQAEQKEINRVYPWIGIGNKQALSNEGTIVLFSKFAHGMILFQNTKAEKHCDVGYIEDNWNMNCFDEFNGEITLANGLKNN